MKGCEIVTLLGGGVEFVRPGGSRLHLPDSLEYFWVDGGRHRAASVDFERSGFVDVRFCELCGTRMEDMEATYVRRRAEPPPPLVFDYEESLGLDLFTTDLSPTAFFSTDRVLDCVRRSKLTNIQFVPTKDGALGKPIRY
jgi:hypothetical protein